MQTIFSYHPLVILLATNLILSACNSADTVPFATPASATNAPAAEIATAPSTPLPPDPTQISATQTEPGATPSLPSAVIPPTCPLTPTDMLGPFYTPGAPQRDQVGTGYLLSGVVRSGRDCSPVPGAQLDFWMAGPQGEYGDEWRAVSFSAADGSYRFESHPPPGYSGRPPHIHILVSAPGYQTLVTQHYPAPGDTQATFDLVLSPAQ